MSYQFDNISQSTTAYWLIAVVLLYSACLCVSVCEYVFACVLLLFFTDGRIHLFSSLAARVFNKLTYLLTYIGNVPTHISIDSENTTAG